MSDWSLAFSCLTTVAALVALVFSGWQIRQSNKQRLFDRRIKVWSISRGLLELYGKEKTRLTKRNSEPEFSNGLQFAWLTNNSFLYEVSDVMSYVLVKNERKAFLQKMEEIKEVAVEASLIFTRRTARYLSEFVYKYQALLFAMYQYEITLNNMGNYAGEFQWTLEKAAGELNEEEFRNAVYDARDELKLAYDAFNEKEISKRIEKQIRLSRWS